jgi:hypothetical protein
VDSDLTGQPDLATGQPSNPYLDLLQDERQQADTALRANVSSALPVNPEQFAKAKRTADYLGYPVGAVQAMPQLENQAKVQQVADHVQGSPALQRAYTDADFAKLAHDDSGVLSSLQDAFMYAVGGQGSGVGAHGATSDGYGPTLAGDAYRAVESSAAKLAKVGYAAIGAAPVLYDKAASALTGEETTAAGDAYFRNTLSVLDRRVEADALPADANFGRKAVTAVGGLATTLGAIYATGGGSEAPAAADAVGSVGQFLREAFTHGAKSMAVPATSDALDTYQNVLFQTGDTAAAAKAAVTQYGVSSLSGMAPLSVPGRLATRLATGFAAGTVTGEASRQAMNAVLPDGMQSGFNTDEAVLSGIMGMGMAGVLGPRVAPSFHEAVRETYRQAQQVDDAARGAQQILNISELAQSSKLRERDPATFKQTVSDMLDDPGALKAVYIKGEQLDEVLAQAGQSEADVARLMPEVAKQLAEARATGGDVRIPMEDFATHIAGSPLESALTPHLRIDPEGMTLSEAQAASKEQASGLKDQAKTLVEKSTQDEQSATELDAIHDNVLDQITATGRYRPEVAKTYAALTRSYYETTAARAGMSPKELFDAHPLHVGADEMPGERLEQTDRAEHELLQPLNESRLAGGETLLKDYGDVKAFEGDYVSSTYRAIRFVKYNEAGNPVSALHIVTKGPRSKKGVIKNIYTAESSRRQGEASSLLRFAQQEFSIKHSDHLTDDGRAFKAADGKFYQVAGDGARGTYDPATNTITALKDADLSTYLHELGHHFLETHAKLAAGENAPEGIKADLQTFLDHVGVKDDPAAWLGRSLEDRRAAHEEFARSFEEYLREGKAPSMELQGLFARFRSWLLSVYQRLSSVPGSRLSDEVRAVMDRMLASDAAIHEAEQARAMFSFDKAPEGVTEKQLAAYLAAGQHATDEAKALLTARALRDMRWIANAKSFWVKGFEKEAKEARARIETGVVAEVRELPVYKAKAYLDEHTGATAESRAAQKTYSAVRAKAEKDTAEAVKAETLAANPEAKGLKKGQLLAKNKRAMANEAERRMLAWDAENRKPGLERNSVEMDLVAEQNGFANGDDMLRAIAEAPAQADLVKAMTDQRMLEQHGDLTDPKTVELAAEAAIHNESRARMMATGLQLLTKSPVSPTQLAKAAKAAAESAVSAKPVKDLHPKQYAAAEKRANRDVLALAAKDIEGAAKAQREALLNNQLFTAATKAIEDVRKGLDYLARFSKDAVRTKIDADVRGQIDSLLEKFDLRKSAPGDDAVTSKQQSLVEWIDAQVKAGYNPTVTPEMLVPAFRKPVGELSVEQFRGLVDSVKALEKVGAERRKILINGEKVSLDEFMADRLVPKIAERGVRFSEDELNNRAEDRLDNAFLVQLDHFKSWLRRVAFQLKPREFQRNEYDRHELAGPFGEAITDPVIEAAYRKTDMLKGLSEDFAKVADELGTEWQDSLREKVANDRLVDPDKTAQGPTSLMSFTRGRMIGMALHVGNESNFDKLTKGWGWQQADVLRFLKRNMTTSDWHAVQATWDLYEKHWPETEAMYRRLGQTIPRRSRPGRSRSSRRPTAAASRCAAATRRSPTTRCARAAARRRRPARPSTRVRGCSAGATTRATPRPTAR